VVVISHIYDVLFCLTYCYLGDYTSIPFLSGPKEFALPTKTNHQLRKVSRNKGVSSVHRGSRGMGAQSEQVAGSKKLAEKSEFVSLHA